jgi:RNA polymerase sigma-70 factor (ECF subfamily)
MTARLELVPDDRDGERSLARLAASGDAEAFERLYRQHAGRVFALCLRMTGSSQRATELTQDVFVRVWRRLATWRGDAALSTWIHRLTVNLIISNVRGVRRRQSREVDVTDADKSRSTPPRSVDSAVDLERAIAALPPGARTVFVLHDIEGYQHDEIARLTGTAEGTCRAQLHRARRLLMENLDR